LFLAAAELEAKTEMNTILYKLLQSLDSLRHLYFHFHNGKSNTPTNVSTTEFFRALGILVRLRYASHFLLVTLPWSFPLISHTLDHHPRFLSHILFIQQLQTLYLNRQT
jgi:hypothetical protein